MPFNCFSETSQLEKDSKWARIYELVKKTLLILLFVPTHSMSDLFKRLRFSWDLRSVSWTDRKGNQEDYVNAVTSWKSFHNKLLDTNSNKISENLRGIMLYSHVYGRAKDICKRISFSEIISKNGVDLICEALHIKKILFQQLGTPIMIFRCFYLLKGEIMKVFKTLNHVSLLLLQKWNRTEPVLYQSQLQHLTTC